MYLSQSVGYSWALRDRKIPVNKPKSRIAVLLTKSVKPRDPNSSLRQGGHSGVGMRRVLGVQPRWQSKALVGLRAQQLLHFPPVRQVGFPLAPWERSFRPCGNSVWMKSSGFMHSAPNYPRMKSDAQLSLALFNAVSPFLPFSLCALFLVPDLFSLCFYGFCSSKSGCCLARRAVAWFKP